MEPYATWWGVWILSGGKRQPQRGFKQRGKVVRFVFQKDLPDFLRRRDYTLRDEEAAPVGIQVREATRP